jgi:hypothetical protein
VNKREARRIAHHIAYRFVQQALDGGGHEAYKDLIPDHENDENQAKVEEALDHIAQRHFELSRM